MVANPYNPSYLEGIDRRTAVQASPAKKIPQDHI
jgi:hypothetical protein